MLDNPAERCYDFIIMEECLCVQYLMSLNVNGGGLNCLTFISCTQNAALIYSCRIMDVVCY